MLSLRKSMSFATSSCAQASAPHPCDPIIMCKALLDWVASACLSSIKERSTKMRHEENMT